MSQASKILKFLGIDTSISMKIVKGLPSYIFDLRKFENEDITEEYFVPFGRYYPCLADRESQSGTTKGHYFHQDLLVARKIYENSPKVHTDIGSRIDGFVAHVASYRSINVLDIRPLDVKVPNIKFYQADLMKSIPEDIVNSCDSLSCLHALEHFGLGRYGDPISAKGHLVGLENLHKILVKGGTLYLSVPIGNLRVEFNAHRIFSIKYLLNMFKEKFTLKTFSYVDDSGDLHENIVLNEKLIKTNLGCRFGCGIFELTKK